MTRQTQHSRLQNRRSHRHNKGETDEIIAIEQSQTRQTFECTVNILNSLKERLEPQFCVIYHSTLDQCLYRYFNQISLLMSCELNPSKLRAFAHFRLWLDISIDYIELNVCSCHIFAWNGCDGLLGCLSEFYISDMTRTGTFPLFLVSQSSKIYAW